jgi:DNA-binding NarL/FixJ family response regulator
MSVRHINGGIVIRPRSPDFPAPDAEPMTGREQEVLSLVAEGFSNKLVAAELGICERTVKNHLTSIMTKLRAADRTHAVVTAVRLGWLAI